MSAIETTAASSRHLQRLLLFVINIYFISVTAMYLKVRHRKSHWVLSLWEPSPPPTFMSIPVRIEINILIMYSSNLLLTQILTSLRACPAMARSYRGRMPQLCPARLCPYSGSSRFLRPLCPVERRGLSSWAKGAGWRRWL